MHPEGTLRSAAAERTRTARLRDAAAGAKGRLPVGKTVIPRAALFEESAAAAESLRQQAQQLVSAVAVFKLA